MDTCDKLKIKLFLVIFPNFSAECDGYYDRILNLSNKKVIIINYERKNYRDKNLYYDGTHFDIKGAQMFTKEVADSINNYLK